MRAVRVCLALRAGVMVINRMRGETCAVEGGGALTLLTATIAVSPEGMYVAS
jgi:hypothetical protein